MQPLHATCAETVSMRQPSTAGRSHSPPPPPVMPVGTELPEGDVVTVPASSYLFGRTPGRGPGTEGTTMLKKVRVRGAAGEAIILSSWHERPIARVTALRATRARGIRGWSRRRTARSAADYGGDGPDGEPAPIILCSSVGLNNEPTNGKLTSCLSAPPICAACCAPTR